MEYFKIGKIVATHGVSGKMIIRHSLGKKSDFKNVQALFIEESNDTFIPWFITSATGNSDTESLLSLDGIDSKESARKYLQKEIWLTEDDFKKLADKTAPISLLGFEIIDHEINLGKIIEVVEQPHQTLCKILLDDVEAWIPLNEAFLERIDQKNKRVIVSLPDGLLDVFRNV